ncbi:ribonuclease PH [Shimazuella alba]|uniref:Ribonuclease PH n=1 Tax=Shimazuella alba TaxID=2690964 RepID=A0A6I4VXM6_9BACL|nr:ribonuclease PH [Shimazuella alba]MXQ54715.1 ribonuclease PH [Shimazuella alba]
MRTDGRNYDELRRVEIIRDYIKPAEGSVFISIGDTRVICTATVEEKVPPFLRNSGKGWITAEYSMLPRATGVRTIREASKGKVTGRTMEIQRLIGRALRSVVDLKALGERTLWIDCDVIQADGGTRTTAITGAFVAMVDALIPLFEKKALKKFPVKDFLAATSVGIIGEKACLDLCYEEDSSAVVDMNVIMTGKGKYVEIQGTGEENPFTPEQLQEMLTLARKGTAELTVIQKQLLGNNAEFIGGNNG